MKKVAAAVFVALFACLSALASTATAASPLNQYVVTYGRPDKLIPPEKLQVTTTRPGLTVRARTRIAGR